MFARVLGLAVGHAGPRCVDIERSPEVFRDLDDVASGSQQRRASRAWIAVLLVAAGAAMIARTTEELRIPCAFGTLPLVYRHGPARVFGCISPDGARHGVWTQAEDASDPTWRGRYRFGRRNGAFTFFDVNGGRLEAGFCDPRPCGTWRYIDAAGTTYRLEQHERLLPPRVEGARCDFQSVPVAAGTSCLPYTAWP